MTEYVYNYNIYIYIYIIGVMGQGLFVLTDLYNDNIYICIYIIYIYNICINVGQSTFCRRIAYILVNNIYIYIGIYAYLCHIII